MLTPPDLIFESCFGRCVGHIIPANACRIGRQMSQGVWKIDHELGTKNLPLPGCVQVAIFDILLVVSRAERTATMVNWPAVVGSKI